MDELSPAERQHGSIGHWRGGRGGECRWHHGEPSEGALERARWGGAHYRAGHDELTTGSVLLAMALRPDVWGVEASGRG